MKKLLILLFSILISFNSYGEEVELDFSLDSFCDQSPKVQVRNNLYYLPNKEKPYSGENICVYLSNGQYFSQGKIKKGLRDGTWSFWYENGQKKAEGNYKDGEFDGKATQWYEHGQIGAERNYKDGKLDGKFTKWYEHGQIESERNYKDGKLDGKFTSWLQYGQIDGVAYFKDDKLISEIGYHENGQIESEKNCGPYSFIVNFIL